MEAPKFVGIKAAQPESDAAVIFGTGYPLSLLLFEDVATSFWSFEAPTAYFLINFNKAGIPFCIDLVILNAWSEDAPDTSLPEAEFGLPQYELGQFYEDLVVDDIEILAFPSHIDFLVCPGEPVRIVQYGSIQFMLDVDNDITGIRAYWKKSDFETFGKWEGVRGP